MNKAILDPFQPEKKEDIEHLKAIQEELHGIFINLVKERRGGRLAEHDDLFTGLFWSGERGRELGLVDTLGDMRSYLKSRYGEKTRLKLVSQPRGLFGRRLSLFGAEGRGSDIAAAATTGLLQAVEEQALWRRYGL